MRAFQFLAGASLTAILLAGCGANHAFGSPSSMLPQAGAPLSAEMSHNEKILHRFSGGRDGEGPNPALIDVNGTLYGTTSAGGSAHCLLTAGCGTVFSIDSSGAGYRVLHRFPSSGLHGEQPSSGVIHTAGALFGTTVFGGSGRKCFAGCGTTYKIDPSGAGFAVVHNFLGKDGCCINGGLTERDGVFYGVAEAGGTENCNCGVLYTLSPQGKEIILRDFAGNEDGSTPIFRPTDVNGTVYGTTLYGGDNGCGRPLNQGCGTIYKISPSGKGYQILYRFKGAPDGQLPNNVIVRNGMLYGTTTLGGGTLCGSPSGTGCGTIFEISTSGKGYRVLYRFKHGSGGWSPDTIAMDPNGMLYGATYSGGNAGCTYEDGCGTVFTVDPSGENYRVLYRFKGGQDGANPGPYAPIEIDGMFYGTTFQGGGTGCGGFGCGTVFALTP